MGAPRRSGLNDARRRALCITPDASAHRHTKNAIAEKARKRLAARNLGLVTSLKLVRETTGGLYSHPERLAVIDAIEPAAAVSVGIATSAADHRHGAAEARIGS